MGNCTSKGKIQEEAAKPQWTESIHLCDENLEDAELGVPEIDCFAFTPVRVDWESIGRLIPYDPALECDESNTDAEESLTDTSSTRGHLNGAKQRYTVPKPDQDVAQTLHNMGTATATTETKSINKFKEALDLWSNFKISATSAKKLHNVTDAFNYCDNEHVPLPQSLFASHGRNSIDELLEGTRSSSRVTSSRATSRKHTSRSNISSSRVENASETATNVEPSVYDPELEQVPSSRTALETTESPEPVDWLNYELVLRPYLSEDKSSHIYKCVVRPRDESSSHERAYNLDDELIQLLGNILDPFQFQKDDENRLRVMTKIKRLLHSSSIDEPEQHSHMESSDQEPLKSRTVHRMTKSATRRAEHLRYLSTISDSGASYAKTQKNHRNDFGVAAALGMEDAICYHMEPMDPKKPCQPRFRRRPKRSNRFGDLSDIPLLA